MAKADLIEAKNLKRDEFYTQLTDVSKEMMHYKEHFKGKIILCNCDDPTWSAFWKYFHLNFEALNLKKLISTHYDRTEPTYKMEYTGGDDNDIEVGIKTPLEGNGDFRNQECLDLIDEADIIVTNPPFSLFREYIAILMEHNKKFIVWGNNNAISYKEIFPLIKDGKVWGGYMFNKTCIFRVGEGYKFDSKITESMNDGHHYGKVPSISTFTNLDIKKRHEKLVLWKNYSPDEYPKYDNYDAINVDRTVDIPCDYDGVMGVPITFLDKYNPDQFEIITLGSSPDLFTPSKKYEGLLRHNKDGSTTKAHIACNQCLTIALDSKPNALYCTADNAPNKYLVVPYARVLIRRKGGN